MLAGLGKAVAEANMEMSSNKGPNNTVMTIPEAEIELKIAISVSSNEELQAGGSLALQVFSVNASYAKSFGFKEEASSRITLKLAAKPAPPPDSVEN
jgi:hypothetical protein